MNKPKIISEKVLYKSNLSEVVLAKIKLENGKIVEWDYLKNEDVVSILPVDKDGNVYLVKEWRPAWRKYILQIPAGHCPYKTKSGIIKQAHNELREEIGMDAKKLKKIISYAASARIKYTVHIFLAQELFESYKEPDEDELIEIVKIPFKDAYKLFIKEGELTTSSTMLALTLAKELINN